MTTGVAAACLGALTAGAAAQAPPGAGILRSAIEDVGSATVSRYAARDDQGVSLDALKVIQADGRYLGVHHATVGGRFELRLVTSTDLVTWTHRVRLDSDATQGTIARLPDGGYLVAYEWGHTLVGLPKLQLPPSLATVSGLVDRINIRFRYYRSVDDLLAGRSAQTFTAPRRLGFTAEGTPSIARADLPGGLPGSRIDVGMHYFADTNGDPFPDVDRQATGTLRDFRSWSAAPATSLNDAFLTLSELHAGFATAPQGNIGDRDEVNLGGAPFVVHEAQYLRGDFASWRIFLRDPAAGTLSPLAPRTAGGSRAFGNPTVTHLTAPSGRPALLITLFVFSEGAAPGEAGPLVYLREL